MRGVAVAVGLGFTMLAPGATAGCSCYCVNQFARAVCDGLKRIWLVVRAFALFLFVALMTLATVFLLRYVGRMPQPVNPTRHPVLAATLHVPIFICPSLGRRRTPLRARTIRAEPLPGQRHPSGKRRDNTVLHQR